MKIAFIPLDDRPCNLDQVIELARIARIDLRVPPRERVASHGGSYDFEWLLRWLEAELPQADAAVLSCELLFYGGLMHSRTMAVRPEEAQRRLAELSSLFARYPRSRIYLSSVLLRLSVTVDKAMSEGAWRNVFDYLVRADGGGLEELASIQSRIPAGILEEFLAARKRNHAINLGLVGLAERVSYVIYGQEDCAERGLHRTEKERLRAEIDRLHPELARKFHVLTGADELGAMLVMRAYQDWAEVAPGGVPVSVIPSDPEGLLRVSKYEDVTVEENLRLHLEPSPLRWAREGSAQSRILVRTFGPEGQGDLCFDEQPSADPAAEDFALQVRPDDSVLDLTLGNGASVALTAKLLSQRPWQELRSFSAWNTTGNRVGTLVAHLGLREAAQARGTLDRHADRAYLFARLADDFLYQACVRPVLRKECAAAGHDAWALGEHWSHYSNRCQELMLAEAARYGFNQRFHATLPWPRLFESRVDLLSSG